MCVLEDNKGKQWPVTISWSMSFSCKSDLKHAKYLNKVFEIRLVKERFTISKKAQAFPMFLIHDLNM